MVIIAEGYYKIRELPRGEVIKRKKDAHKMFIKGHYDRASKSFAVWNVDDMNEEYFVKSSVMVYAGFTY
jgi:hypothetical protein